MLIENGDIDSLTNQVHSLTMVSKDGIVSCTLAQQVVSENLVRDIKRAKSSAGWAMVAAGLSSMNAGMARSQMNNGRNQGWAMQNYIDAREDENADVTEKFQSYSEPDDDNSRMHEVRMDRCRYLTTFKTPKGEIQLTISHESISSCFVVLSYFDKINGDVIRAKAMDDL